MREWTTLVKEAMRQEIVSTFEFVSILTNVTTFQSDGSPNADSGIFLTNFDADLFRASSPGNQFLAGILKGASPPPVTGTLDQEVQRLVVSQGRAQIGEEDFIAALGPNYHGARVEVASYPVHDTHGLLDGNDVAFRGIALLKGVARNTAADEVILSITNSFGQLRQTRELRTTRGSLARLNPADTSFDKASDLSDTTTLEWGSDVGS